MGGSVEAALGALNAERLRAERGCVGALVSPLLGAGARGWPLLPAARALAEGVAEGLAAVSPAHGGEEGKTWHVVLHDAGQAKQAARELGQVFEEPGSFEELRLSIRSRYPKKKTTKAFRFRCVSGARSWLGSHCSVEFQTLADALRHIFSWEISVHVLLQRGISYKHFLPKTKVQLR